MARWVFEEKAEKFGENLYILSLGNSQDHDDDDDDDDDDEDEDEDEDEEEEDDDTLQQTNMEMEKSPCLITAQVSHSFFLAESKGKHHKVWMSSLEPMGATTFAVGG